jgi:hypothetical protein
MTEPTTEQMAGVLLDEFVRQYCTKLEQLNYGPSDDQCLPASITRLRQLMVEHDVALDALTPDIAAELVLGADWYGDRRPYVVFVVRRFVAYLATLGVAMPPTPPTAREFARSVDEMNEQLAARQERREREGSEFTAAPTRQRPSEPFARA